MALTLKTRSQHCISALEQACLQIFAPKHSALKNFLLHKSNASTGGFFFEKKERA
jgi:hypothetical protein